ncbi:hypothetical protein L596_014394 [Steinernema carpocapsae]|uniref:Uncharacterized protein n=1 Tax=Steinernema carpocapsae TaxID=34508 RepID=A0A4V6A2R4_STECR|nr:hypothetical protein L596_014394 [Steinernema carpocapsae]
MPEFVQIAAEKFGMSAQFLGTPSGLLYLVQLIIGVIAGFIIQVIWDGGNIFVSFFLSNYPMQTYVYFAIFITNVAVLALILMEINQGGSTETLGKTKLLIFHVICSVLILIAACMESYYVSTGPIMSWRFWTTMFILWVLFLTHVAQVVLGFLFK